MSDERPRVLILRGHVTDTEQVARALRGDFHVDIAERVEDAMASLRHTDYHAVFADIGDFLPLERSLVGQQASLVLNTIGEGVCVIDSHGVCRWSNARMRSFPAAVFEKVKLICLQALGIFSTQMGGLEHDAPRSKKFALQVGDERYFELITSPVVDEQTGEVSQVVAVVWDATSGRRLQQKLDAIDAAGRELARLETEAVSKLSPGERLRLLQDKIIRYCKNLLHFDHFAIRLLDKRANKLEVVIHEGMPPEALEIDLYAEPEGNGIGGYVAATGRSYICHDTEKDARYVMGLEHCKSSLTVPLMLFDEVVGVFNIESQSVGSFDEDDRQFAEILGRYVALALHILDLLVVERCMTTGAMADSVVEEVAQPLNDIITEAESMCEEYIGEDSMRSRLNRIVDHAGSIREAINAVKAGPNTVLGTGKVEADGPVDPILHGRHILIADDEASIRETIHDVLKKFGCNVTICKDGYEAISLIEQQPFDLIISDIKMPHRNGYEIYAAAHRANEDMPVILMTGFGYDPNHSIVRATQEGLSSVLFKPFKVDQLLGEARKAISGDSVEQEAKDEADSVATNDEAGEKVEGE